MEQRAALHADRMVVGGAVGLLLVPERPGDVHGKMLKDRSAEDDVHRLHAEADAEERFSRFVGGLREEEIRGDALLRSDVRFRALSLAEVGRVDVGAAREDDAVEPVDHGARLLPRLEKRENDRDRPFLDQKAGIVPPDADAPAVWVTG